MKKIEFMGMPRAGKSTQIELLDSILKHAMGLKVRSLSEGARISPLDKGQSFLFNAWSFNNMANRIMEYSVHPIDYLLIDRGVYDHIAFADALYMTGKITLSELGCQQEYFRQFIRLEDDLILFSLSAQESLKREQSLHAYTGRVMNPHFLKALEQAYECNYSRIQKYFGENHLVVDSSKPLANNKNEILDFVLRQ